MRLKSDNEGGATLDSIKRGPGYIRVRCTGGGALLMNSDDDGLHTPTLDPLASGNS